MELYMVKSICTQNVMYYLKVRKQVVIILQILVVEFVVVIEFNVY